MASVYQDIYNIPQEAKGCVLSIGNFDGVHKGHKRLLSAARRLADELETKLVVMSFTPHSRKFFNPEIRPFYITPFETKKRLLEELGVDVVFNVNFDLMFSTINCHDFVNKILIEGFNVKHLVVGENFTFGNNKAGGINQLQQAASDGGFDFTVEQDLKDDISLIPISAFAIRDFLKEGNFLSAGNLLGRKWYIEELVIKGNGTGHKLGYPTVNQSASEYVYIPFGVYATKVLIEGENEYRDAVTNFGVRPMFKASSPLVETHIFDYSGDLYGKNLKTVFIEYIRGERTFGSNEELIEQIKKDCEKAKNILAKKDTI